MSVSDKTGIVEFARSLTELQYEILASGGTAKHLEEAGIKVTSVEEYTGQPEILGGRVKTLHPMIHGGLLAKREPDQLAELEKINAGQIDVVAVNLYPFIENLKSDAADDPLKMIELVDIGGPTMLRSAAKNLADVFAVVDPADYDDVIEAMQSEDSGLGSNLRQDLAVKVFETMANYNLAIAKYFSRDKDEGIFSAVEGVVLDQAEVLRYGENPHQQASFYLDYNQPELPWIQLSGKSLSYNNLLDFDAAAACVGKIQTDQHLAVIVKHLNPCGVAIYADQLAALQKAKTSDARSHFGGIIAFNQPVAADTAEEVIKDFAEIVVAPDFSPEAIDILKQKKNLRIIQINFSALEKFEWRSCAGGVLVQEVDQGVSDVSQASRVTGEDLSDQQSVDLQLAWQICSSVKSNAIVIVKDGLMLASGAGQMSRIDAVELAIHKANTHDHDLNGAVAASDAFFPFPDSVEALAAVGVKTIIVTGGSRMDEAVKEKAEELGVTLLFTQDRHFRH